MILDTILVISMLYSNIGKAIPVECDFSQHCTIEVMADAEKPNLYDYTLERRMERWRRDKQRYLRFGPYRRPLPPPPTPDYYYHDCPWCPH